MQTTRPLRRTRRAPVLALLLAGLVLAGCATGPSQLGAAAIVGQTRIPVDAVQQQLDQALDNRSQRFRQALDEQGLIPDAYRNIVTVRVLDELTREAARQRNLLVTERQVSGFIQRLGGIRAVAGPNSIFTPRQVRGQARNLLLRAELARRVLARTAVTVHYTTERTRRAAMQRADQLAEAGPGGARRLIRAQVTRGAAAALDQRIVAAQNPEMAAAPPFGVPAGTVVAFPSTRRLGAWLVMVVTQRGTGGAGTEQLDATRLTPDLLQAVGLRNLALLGQQRGVRINPRFGVWDPVQVRVAPNRDQRGGFITPLVGARAA